MRLRFFVHARGRCWDTLSFNNNFTEAPPKRANPLCRARLNNVTLWIMQHRIQLCSSIFALSVYALLLANADVRQLRLYIGVAITNSSTYYSSIDKGQSIEFFSSLRRTDEWNQRHLISVLPQVCKRIYTPAKPFGGQTQDELYYLILSLPQLDIYRSEKLFRSVKSVN